MDGSYEKLPSACSSGGGGDRWQSDIPFSGVANHKVPIAKSWINGRCWRLLSNPSIAGCSTLFNTVVDRIVGAIRRHSSTITVVYNNRVDYNCLKTSHCNIC